MGQGEKEKDMVPRDNSPAQLSSIGLLFHPNYKMYFVLVPKDPLHSFPNELVLQLSNLTVQNSKVEARRIVKF
jgi:hypothetical protein